MFTSTTSQLTSSCLDDDASFGPVVGPDCRGGFDFTWAFEQYMLSLTPAALFMAIAFCRLRVISRRPTRLRAGPMVTVKLVAICAFAALQLALLGLWLQQPSDGARSSSVASYSLSFVACFVLGALSYLEHRKSLRPSMIINAFLLVSVVFDAAILRTLWLTPALVAIRNVFTASFALRSVLLLLEASEKRRYLSDTDRRRSPEETAGLYSLALFWWLNGLIRRGFRSTLRPDDLYHVTDDMSAAHLHAKFWSAWSASNRSGKHKLVWVCVSAFRANILLPVLPRLFLVAFTFCQPFLVNRFLEFLQSPDQPSNIGYGLVGAYGLVYFGMGVSNAMYNYYWFRCLTMMRSFLVTAVFSKTIDLSIAAQDNAAAVTLMSADVETIIRNLRDINELWANLIQISIATALLAVQLGPACVAPLVLAVVTTGITIYAGKFTVVLQKGWMSGIQKRIGVTSAMLGHMKSIKLSGLTLKLAEIIADLRFAELQAAKKFYLLGSFTGSIAYVPMLIAPLVTFAAYIPVGISNGTSLDSSRLFTTLSLVTLLAQPLFSVFQDILNLKSSFGCFERLQDFLSAPDREDVRCSDTQTIVSIKGGNFGWVKDKPLLKNIHLELNTGLNILIGPVGCGKSTLLKAILGETPYAEGVNIATSQIAWCEQTPWLINATVQRNIIGYATLDENLYREVIYCCALEADLATFPHGDQSMIGSKGIVLSGGQKQRVAIARAVYARKDLAIFDDVFSGLDATTQHHVFTHVFGKTGLLRRRHVTVLLATHAVDLLPHADYIVALKEDGTVVEQGSYADLASSHGYVSSFSLKDSKDVVPPSKRESDSLKTKPSPTPSATSSHGDLSVYKYYFQKIGWQSTLVFLLLQIVWTFLYSFPNVWLEWWAESNDASPNQRNGYYVGVYAALEIAAVCCMTMLTWYCLCVMAMKAGFQLHSVLLRTVMFAPMTFFNNTDVGNITTRFSQDMNLLDRSLALSVLCTVNYLFICIAQGFLIASATYYIALSFPAVIAVFYFIQMYYLRTSRQLRFMDLEEKAPVYSQFLETLGGLATVRAFSWQRDALTHNFDLVERSQKPFYLLFMIQRWLTLVLDLVTASLAVLVTAMSVGLRDHVSVGFAGVSLTQLISFTGYMKLFMLFWTQLETSIGAVSRIKQFETDIKPESLPDEKFSPDESWPSEGEIRIDNISAAYSPEATTDALKSLSLIISPGERIGICGRTGSGKSSLILALLRMLELKTGCIVIDGVDLATVPRDEVRLRLNTLVQDPFFLVGTVRLNLDPFARATDAEAIAALDKVGLWPIVEEKGGLDLAFSDDILSHGQRQLFCLARAIMRPGKIVILDEATSSVDRKTDELMQKIIRQEFHGHTIIAIAHRLNTIVDFDRIVVIDEGCIVECDRPAALLQRESKFKELYGM